MPIQGDFTAVGIIKAHQKVNQGGFTCTGGANNRYQISLVGVKIEVMNNRFTRQISKLHMLHLHIAFHIA